MNNILSKAISLALLIVTVSPIAQAESHYGNRIDTFQGRAVVPTDAPNQKAFVDLYKNERLGLQHERTAFQTEYDKRKKSLLTRRVLTDFQDAIGADSDFLGIIYAEGINNDPILGGKGKIDHHRESAKAFAELFGSIPRDEDLNMAGKIKALRDQFEQEREALEKDKDPNPEEKEELSYLKLAMWASDEATKILKEGEEYESPQGDEESQKFRRAFGEAFEEKLERNREEHALFRKAAAGDAAAKKELLKKNPVTLLTYAAAQKVPEKAAEAIRALGLGEDNKVTLYDTKNGNKPLDVTFGKTTEEINKTIDDWRDRYASGDFSLQPAVKERAKKGAVSQTPVSAGASDEAQVATRSPVKRSAAPSKTPQRANAFDQAAITAAQQEALKRQAERLQADQIVQQRAQQANAQRRARQQQAAGRTQQALSQQAKLARANQLKARQAAMARYNLARILDFRRRQAAQFASLKRRPVPRSGGGGGGGDAVADPEGYIEKSCKGCHSVDELPEMIANADPDGILADMPYNGTPMDEDEKNALIEWANSI